MNQATDSDTENNYFVRFSARDIIFHYGWATLRRRTSLAEENGPCCSVRDGEVVKTNTRKCFCSPSLREGTVSPSFLIPSLPHNG